MALKLQLFPLVQSRVSTFVCFSQHWQNTSYITIAAVISKYQYQYTQLLEALFMLSMLEHTPPPVLLPQT